MGQGEGLWSIFVATSLFRVFTSLCHPCRKLIFRDSLFLIGELQYFFQTTISLILFVGS